MAGPENKESIPSGLGANSSVQLPKPDKEAIMSSGGSAQLPARPQETTPQPVQQNTKMNVELEDLQAKLRAQQRLEQVESKLHKEQDHSMQLIAQHRIEDIGILVAKSEQERKAFLLSALSHGETPSQEVFKLAEVIMQISTGQNLPEGYMDIAHNMEMLNQLRMHIQQQRSFDCSAQDLAMLDSLEFHIMRLMAHINPNIRNQQQQQVQEDMNRDDESGSSGPDKAEDERGESFEGIEDVDVDSDYSYSPRSKKGKARARGRDRRSRFKKWLALMMRVFRGQSIRMPTISIPKAKQSSTRERRFIKTVRLFGRVIDTKTNQGIEGVKIFSPSLGTVITSKDGSYAFENVTFGASYSLAPLKTGYSFDPASVNDVALDFREHNFRGTKE